MLLMFGEAATTAHQVGIKRSTGYVYHDRFKPLLTAPRIYLSSPRQAESLPLVVQESMACGTHIVAFPVGGTVDLVRPGVTGYLAGLEDPQDLARGIVQLLEDESLRVHMSQQCRNIALGEYSLAGQVQRHIDLYRQILSRGWSPRVTRRNEN